MSEDNPVIQAAKEYAANTAVYKSMTEIGKVLGVCSHVVGKKLKEIGLRTADGDPSLKAKIDGYVKSAATPSGYMFDIWHEAKTLAALRPILEKAKQ